MTDDNKQLNLIEKWSFVIESLASHYTSIYSEDINDKQIFEALFLILSAKYEFEWQGDLWDVEIELSDAIDLLSNFDFSILRNTVETEEGLIPKDFLIQYKVRIKVLGLIWVIHKTDADPFPSDPHAHQLDNNIKLDLSNGNCYKQREFIYKIKRKDLMKFRKATAKVFKGDIPVLKC